MLYEDETQYRFTDTYTQTNKQTKSKFPYRCIIYSSQKKTVSKSVARLQMPLILKKYEPGQHLKENGTI